jgi:transglutaminase-like putative cysteine protease
MRLHIYHETHYCYSIPVYGMVMEARLRPCNDDYQFCHRYRLNISPKSALQEYTMFSDTSVYYWSLLKVHEVSVISESVVETRERPLLPIQVPPPEVDYLEIFPYLQPTPLTRVTPEIQDFAHQFSQVARTDWYQAALQIRGAIFDTLEFTVGATHTQTTASDALVCRCGVCQDFTHLMIACLRVLGIPARYVSGYLNPDTGQKSILAGGIAYQSMSQMEMSQGSGQPNPNSYGERSVRGTGASHAWCEVYMGRDMGWRGFDPTNNLLIDHHYVRIGAGRDFNDVTPIKGVHKGPAEESLTVSVRINAI